MGSEPTDPSSIQKFIDVNKQVLLERSCSSWVLASGVHFPNFLSSLVIRIVIYINKMLLLCQHSRVLEKLFAQVVAFLEKLSFLVKMEKCSVTPCHCIVFLAAHLDSTIVTRCLPQYCERTSTSPRSKEWIIEDSFHSDQMHEPCFSDKDHACPASLQKSPVVTPTSGGSIWP